MKIKKKIFLFFIVLSIAVPGFVYALETTYPTVFGLSLGDDPSLPEYAKYFFNIGIMAAGILAVIVVAFGGTLYLVSSLRGQFTDEGKQWIKAGILGLLLIMSSYLIAYTINPALVIFDLKDLAPLTFLANLFETPESSLPVEIYHEIPIGTLIENALVRQIGCYNYDYRGDPIPGSLMQTDNYGEIYGPTYLENDRPDCFLKLSQAIEKKSVIVEELAKKITEIMSNCICSNNCETEWSPECPDVPPCIGEATCKPGKKECCSDEIRDKIEHGLINMDDWDYVGLDEFRSEFNNDYNAIKGAVEVSPAPKTGNRNITVINVAAERCGVCDYDCPICQPSDDDCFEKRQECKQEEENCKNNLMECQKRHSPWHNLRLIDQLTYLRGRAEEIKTQAEEDLSNLTRAETELGNCYLADSYVDFMKIYEATDKKDKVILVQTSYTDPVSSEPANPSKYCKGFEYGNSTCYSQCQKQCPGTTEADFNCYAKAPSCRGLTDSREKNKCLAEQTTIIKDCLLDKRICPPELSPFENFSECINNCKLWCFDKCEDKTGSEKTVCQKNCSTDSLCLVANQNTCVVDFGALRDCTDPSDCKALCPAGDTACMSSCDTKYSNLEFMQNCAKTSAFLCQYGSDQNAGYPDCVKPSYYQQEKYSSSFIYQQHYISKNLNTEVCPNPNQFLLTGATCQSQYPQTAKCPSASACPKCPCGINYQYTGGNSNGKVICPPGECIGKDGVCSFGNCPENTGNDCLCPTAEPGTPECYKSCEGSSSGGGASLTFDYRFVEAKCDEFSYNDDPLTFYCSQSWWKKSETSNQKPMGESFTCPKEKEIPVGNAVDDAETWAGEFISVASEFITYKADELIDYMKMIGRQTDYCECASKCVSGEYACLPKCELVNVGDGNPQCERTDCGGNPCQQMIGLLVKRKDPCGGDGVKKYSDQVKQGLGDVKDFIFDNQRSDILKELAYSRKAVDSCSQNYSKQTKILSCTRVEDEIIPPIIGDTGAVLSGDARPTNSYCYGQALGEIKETENPLADNWFCCQLK